MRQIERQMIDAIKANKSWRNGNTEVRSNGSKWAVLLFNNHIASGGPDAFSFSLAGWNTNTTRSRLNALLREFTNGYSVYQQKGEPYFNGRAINTTGWLQLSYVDGEWR